MRPSEHVGLPVARYLRPEEAVVPFQARPELDELLRWCTSGAHTAVLLVTGDGGTGKTRLALRLAEELAAYGWQPLWVRSGSERDAVTGVRTLGQPCVLVVDYAETHSDLAGLLDDVAAYQDGPELRVLLLARSAGEWWQQLLAVVDERAVPLLEAAALITLGPVSTAGNPQEVFDCAVTAFAQKLGTERPDASMVLADPDPPILEVHAAALLAVVDHALGAQPHQTASGPEALDGLLIHEARYWVRTAAGRGLDLDTSVLRRAVVAGSLIGAENETDASALLSRIPDLEDLPSRRHRVARWLRDLYPVPPARGVEDQEWIGSIQPEVLAERLVVGELTAVPHLIPLLFTGLTAKRATKALTLLGRAFLTDPAAGRQLDTAIRSDLAHLMVPALTVAVETNSAVGELIKHAIESCDLSPDVLSRIASALPHRSFALAETAVAVFRRLVEESADDDEHADRLTQLSSWLSELGSHEEALTANEEAVVMYRRLVLLEPDGHGSRLALARSLNNLSTRRSELGRQQEALSAIEEAVGLYRQLIEDGPDSFRPDLAKALNNMSNRLSELGRQQEALSAIEEAVGLYRQLIEDGPDSFRPDLARALNNWSVCLADLERMKEALAAVEEAVALYRELADDRPDAFMPDLAASLNTQSNRLAKLGRQEDALTAVEDALAIYRRLAYARPDAFLPELARSLNNQSGRLASLERQKAALDAINEAVAIYEKLARERPDKFSSQLAASSNYQSALAADLARQEEKASQDQLMLRQASLLSEGKLSLLNDQPVVDSDHDQLNTWRIAEGLVRILLSSRQLSPFVLAIDAEWGMGKSTVLEQMSNILERSDSKNIKYRGKRSRHRWRCAKFNAWTAENSDALQDLIATVLRELDPKTARRWTRKLAKNRGLGAILYASVVTVAGFFGFSSIVSNFLTSLSFRGRSPNETRSSIRKILSDWMNGSLQDELGFALIVFIDDLDRCSAETMIQVCEAVKLYLDVPGIIFVLGWNLSALDRPGVTDNSDSSANVRAYLDKIIQVTYRLPVPAEEQIRQLIDHCVEMSGTASFFDTVAQRTLAERTRRNPRRIKQIINGFIVERTLSPKWAERPDFLVRAVLIYQLYPELYRILIDNADSDWIGSFLGLADLCDRASILSEEWWNDAKRISQNRKMVISQAGLQDSNKAVEELKQAFPEPLADLMRDGELINLLKGIGDEAMRAEFSEILRDSPLGTNRIGAAVGEAQPSSRVFKSFDQLLSG